MTQALFVYGSTNPANPTPATRVPIKVSSDGTLHITAASTSLSSSTGVFDDVGVNPAIKNLANGSLQISGAIDNTTTLAEFLDLVLNVTGAAAFSLGDNVYVWVLPSLDGTTYEDGSATVTPARVPDAVLPLRAVGTAQVLVGTFIAIPPTKFKILLKNSASVSTQAFDNTAGHNNLVAYMHS